MPYCDGGNGRCYLHSQSGIDLDVDVTAGTRIPVGDEPGMFEHITTCAPHHHLFAAGISDIVPRRRDGDAKPASRSSTSSAAPSPPACVTSPSTSTRNEFMRITGYLVRKSDLVDIDATAEPATAATTWPPGQEDARTTSPNEP